MKIDALVIAVLWVGLFLFWLVASFGSKRSAGGASGGRLARLLVIGGSLLVSRLMVLRHSGAHPLVVGASPVTGGIGTLLCLLGISLAVWARLCLGRNWGMPMTVKEEPELVTSGPYALVRHPIYTGLLLAVLGSALAASAAWLLALPVFGAYFLYSAIHEERRMSECFPIQYPEYRSRTKMLIPFIV